MTKLLKEAKKLCKAKGWELGEFLGEGATASAYRVQTADGPRALKIYSPDLLKGKRGELVRSRLEIVLNTLQGHSCPYLVQVYEGGDAGGTTYMLMQLVPGNCLGKILKLVRAEKVRGIVGQVAEAAKFLEERNLCHRDIKSDNVVLSEDQSHAVLLDLGVVRWLDQEGVGSDQEGVLPFVATARYSSPEYMFRLTPAGPELWRGLTFYQLGGILHDIINGERLFEDVVQRARENRYLIAHAVATQMPTLKTDGGVPIDLILLAQRALDKDISRRLASLEWRNFLDVGSLTKSQIVLGLLAGTQVASAPPQSKVPDFARQLDELLDKRLHIGNIHCRHKFELLSHDQAHVIFEWTPPSPLLSTNEDVTATFRLVQTQERINIDLQTVLGEDSCSSPVISINADGEEQLPTIAVDAAFEKFIELSACVVEVRAKKGNP